MRSAALFAFLFLIGLAAGARAETPYQHVRPSLLHLHAFGTPKTGPSAGVPDSVESQATGFFISPEGFALTVEHFFKPLESVDAINVRIEASIGDAGAGVPKFPAYFISELGNLDLALLKIDLPYDHPRIAPLFLGTSADINPDDPPEIFSSGFSQNSYKTHTISLNEPESDEVPYAWTLNVAIDGGESGSPVYTKNGTVIGLLKGSPINIGTLAIMIPVDFAQPLVGHIKIRELEKEILQLRQVVGAMRAGDPPIDMRLNQVEDGLSEIGKRFEWTATTSRDDGSLQVKYTKLIKGGPQIASIQVQITPRLKLRDGNDVISKDMPSLRLKSDPPSFPRNSFDPVLKQGMFVIADVQDKLDAQYKLVANAVGKPEPYRDLLMYIVPATEDGLNLPPVTLNVSPDYVWK
ncbi:S1 family peptidase [Rhizobium phaseoli]|uniref:S1 family peptidase n=1 Tax=Rhizobium phaseoli TaxID=396 RepID=UPI0013DFF48E|nr:serine protease [Rhizobium phaseoli]